MIVEFKLEYGLKDFVGLKDCEQVKDSIDHGFQWGWRAMGGRVPEGLMWKVRGDSEKYKIDQNPTNPSKFCSNIDS